MIQINEALCDGCGECVTGCAEGALKIIDGKAKVVREDFCDGFGDCVGVCPTGALSIKQVEAKPFDEDAVRAHLYSTQGEGAVRRMENSQKAHQEKHSPPLPHGGCPGSQARTIERTHPPQKQEGGPEQVIPSELAQWPIQLHLVSPMASYFQDKELVLLSTCGPVASADIHWRFLRGRSVVVACPKLDHTSPYADKLAAIFQNRTIPRIHVVMMEVPCCKGLMSIVNEAKRMAKREDLAVLEHYITIDGRIQPSNKEEYQALPAFGAL